MVHKMEQEIVTAKSGERYAVNCIFTKEGEDCRESTCKGLVARKGCIKHSVEHVGKLNTRPDFERGVVRGGQGQVGDTGGGIKHSGNTWAS